MKKSEEHHSSGPGPSNQQGHHEHHDHKHHHEHTQEHGHEHHHGHHDHEHHHSEAHAHAPTTKEQLIAELNINDNGYTLWKWARHSSHENEMISPCGLCIAMAVLQLGSTGHTFKEISSTFKSPGEHGLLTGLHELLNSYQASREDGAEHTHVTTIVFIPSDSTLRRDFVHVVETKFAAVIQTVDYSAEDVLDQMNGRIRHATNSSIEDTVIKTEDLKDHPCVMVISIECFQDQWKLKFDPSQTTSEAFFNGGGKKVDVSMMKINGKFPYADVPAISAAVLGLPFVGDRYMMVIVLPHKRYGLADMERRIDSKFFDTAHLLLKSDDLINVQLPKFTFKTTLDIKFICDKMGMKAMFHDTADLNGMFEKHHHERVTKLTQVLSINVNEFGTGAPPTSATLSSPAAVATANETNVGQTEPSPPPPQQHIIEQQQQQQPQPVEESTGTTTAATSTQQSIPFRVDHPFMYYIVDLKYHYVLLMGIQTKC